MRFRYRRMMVEFWGWLSLKCLKRIIILALSENDFVLAEQALEIVRRGGDVGWDGSPESKLHRWRLTPDVFDEIRQGLK